MKMALLGATGRVGTHLLQLALKEGIHVKALVRSPEKLGQTSAEIIIGNTLHLQDVDKVIEDADVVMCALNTDGGTTISKSMQQIIFSMEKNKCNRIISIGTAGILQARSAPELYRFQSQESKRKSTSAAQDHLKAFQLLQESTLDWTIICPTYLPSGEMTGSFRYEKDFLPKDGSRITTGDTALFALQQMNSVEFFQSRVGLAY